MMFTFVKWIIYEIRYRKVKSFLIILSSLISVFLVTSAYLSFKQYDKFLNFTYNNKITSLDKEMSQMIKKYKKITKQLGFNVLILPKEQNLADFYSDDFASHYMPQYYADTLAKSISILIQHILPALIQKVHWKEINRDVLIYGVKKENSRIHFPNVNKKPPILQAVHQDSIVLGYELWKSLDLKIGDPINLLGNRFYISKKHNQRGNRDDITAWINLKKSQKIFNKENKINAILALECRCEGTEDKANILNIRKDLAKILPNTQVVEYMSKVIARAEARYESVKVKKESIKSEKKYAESVKNKKLILSFFIISSTLIGTILTIIVIVILDIRNRIDEIGQLKLLGFKNHFIISFLSLSIFFLIFLGGLCGSLTSFGFVFNIAPFFTSNDLLFTPDLTIRLPIIILFLISTVLAFIASFVIRQSLKIEGNKLFYEEIK